MLPTSLMLANTTGINVTGVWLTRVIAVYVNHTRVNFTAYGPYSPGDGYPPTSDFVQVAASVTNTVSRTSVPSKAHRWAIQAVDAVDRDISTAHSFHALQAFESDTGCVYPACLQGVELHDGANSLLSFELQPSNETGYIPLTMVYAPLPSANAPPRANWSAADALYVTLAPCDTGLLVGANCETCQPGGYCPGGGRV